MKATKKTTTTKSSKDENSSLMEFFMDELKDIYWAEKHLVKAIPKMKKAATIILQVGLNEMIVGVETARMRMVKTVSF